MSIFDDFLFGKKRDNGDLSPKEIQKLLSDAERLSSEKRYEEAFDLVSRAAEAGSARACYLLACMYEYGEGLTRDAGKAVEYYRRGAEGGDADAMRAFGICYMTGSGVDEDYGEAEKWLRAAVEAGCEDARYDLEALTDICQGPGMVEMEAPCQCRTTVHRKEIQGGTSAGA